MTLTPDPEHATYPTREAAAAAHRSDHGIIHPTTQAVIDAHAQAVADGWEGTLTDWLVQIGLTAGLHDLSGVIDTEAARDNLDVPSTADLAAVSGANLRLPAGPSSLHRGTLTSSAAEPSRVYLVGGVRADRPLVVGGLTVEVTAPGDGAAAIDLALAPIGPHGIVPTGTPLTYAGTVSGTVAAVTTIAGIGHALGTGEAVAVLLVAHGEASSSPEMRCVRPTGGYPAPVRWSAIASGRYVRVSIAGFPTGMPPTMPATGSSLELTPSVLVDLQEAP